MCGFKHRVVVSVGGGFSGGLRDLGGGCGVFWRGGMPSDCVGGSLYGFKHRVVVSVGGGCLEACR
ncbi:hypothetical protein, partial [Bartonella raoultii]|uniref:hypothetical protein n=1 Tax=Bartonella raoultii TaxID=1457020 RepID=UPI001ABADB9A